MIDAEDRLARIEARLARIEAALAFHPAPAPQVPPPTPPATARPAPPAGPPPPAGPVAAAAPSAPRAEPRRGVSAATVLGWAGAAALVLAAAYLIRLGITTGWLTPDRQVFGSALLGLAMLAGGLALRTHDRPYASLLGAAGIVVLYLTIFGAYLVHHLIGATLAAGLILGVAALALALHAAFGGLLYGEFALVGSYSVPLLLPSARGSPLDLTIYLTVWNIVYCACTLWLRDLGRSATGATSPGPGSAGGTRLFVAPRVGSPEWRARLIGVTSITFLYLAVLVGHAFDLDGRVAAALLVSLAALSLGLHAVTLHPMHLALALFGAYVCPLVVPEARGGDAAHLAVYLTGWSVVFAAQALLVERRVVYFVALYASLLTFAMISEDGGAGAWRAAAIFQIVQLLIFTSSVVAFSVLVRRPLTQVEAWAHFPALLLFYGMQYSTLDGNMPAALPLVPIAVAAFLYAGYGAARSLLSAAELPSLILVNAFGALVLFHAVWLQWIAEAWQPLAALLLAVGIGVLPRGARWWSPAFSPYALLARLLFTAGYIQLLLEWGDGVTRFEAPLAVLYPLAAYAAYFALQPGQDLIRRSALLGVAHLQLLTACGLLVYRLLPESGTAGRLWLSFAWAVVGTVFLVLARRRGDQLLARSTLGIFALFAGKVLLFDLAGAAPLVRVGCLIVLGISLYAGGWIYRQIFPGAQPATG